MLSRRLLTSFLIFFCCAVPARPQLPKRLERCLPNPTLAQEIREMQPEPQNVAIHVLRVAFEKKSAIPAELQRQIIAEVSRHSWEEDADSDYLKDAATEIAEVVVRGRLQNQGYFHVLPEAKLNVLRADASDIQVVATVNAKLGPQYRVGTIQIVPADSDKWLSLSAKALRKEMGLQSNEILNVDKLRTDLRRITSIYRKFGFIDMTAEPEFNVDDTKKVIDIVLRIDEQKQYRMGRVEILGLDEPAKEQFLKSLPQPGEIFDGHKVEESFSTNKSNLPPDAYYYDDVSFRRDAKAGTVSLLFDFRQCPGQGK